MPTLLNQSFGLLSTKKRIFREDLHPPEHLRTNIYEKEVEEEEEKEEKE